VIPSQLTNVFWKGEYRMVAKQKHCCSVFNCCIAGMRPAAVACALAAWLALAGPAVAQIPTGCTTNGVTLTISRPLPIICVNNLIDYTVTVSNPTNSCQMTNATVRFWSPANAPNGGSDVCAANNPSCILESGFSLNPGESRMYNFSATSSCAALDFLATTPGTKTAFACIQGTSQTIPGGEPFAAQAQISTAVVDNPTANAGPDQSQCAAASGPTCFTTAGSGTGATHTWSVQVQPSGCNVSIANPGNFATQVCFPAGCTGCATLRLTTTNPPCPNATDDVVFCVNPNPDCTITITPADSCLEPNSTGTACVPEQVAGPTAAFSWTLSGGTITSATNTRCITFTVGPSGTLLFTVQVDLTFPANVVCTCRNTKEVPICVPPAGCRVTGGGNDGRIPPNGYASGTANGNFYTFGGQAGAPLTGCCLNRTGNDQPWGEWTHRQHSGSLGDFTFHGGTASAPTGTLITCISCTDPPACPHAAANGEFKQIDFKGIGTIKNVRASPAGVTFRKGELYAFEVHIEDLGEPGNQGSTDPGTCPPGGSFPTGANCGCRDFYQIKIHADCRLSSPVVYHVFGYIDGGNFQIHEPTGSHKESQCRSLPTCAR
jgi:hypothetical protein